MMRELVIGLLLAAALAGMYLGFSLGPLFLLAALVFLVASGSHLGPVGLSLGPGKKRAKEACFEEIGGQAMAIQELKEALKFLADRDQVRRLGIRAMRGILLSGPPGTGKTLLARAAASYTNSAFHSVSGSEFIEMYAGVGAQRVRRAFDEARRQAKKEKKRGAILFIDEIEIMGGKRGRHSSHLEYDQTLNQLLVEMDGMADDRVPVMVIAATNRADLLDDALLRPGRFDRTVWVDLPDREGRAEILKIHTANKPLGSAVDIEALARETFGFSGAHLESLANEAAILALREGQETLEQRHFLEAVDKVMMGERSSRKPDAKELLRVALHELGHAVVGEVLRPGGVAKVSIAARGASLGYVRQVPGEEARLKTTRDLESDISCLLAGKVAEEIFLGDSSTGAAQDLERASDLASMMVRWGMSSLGLVAWEQIPRRTLFDAVQQVLSAAQSRAWDIISQNQAAIREGADDLMDRETMTGEEIRQLIDGRDGSGGGEQQVASVRGEFAALERGG